MRDKKNLNNSRTDNSSQNSKPTTASKQAKDSDEDGYSDGGFEDDKNDDTASAGTQEDQLEKIRKAMDREKARAIKYIENKPSL